MVFENDKLRIGPPAITESLFLMPDPKRVKEKGKRFEIPEYLTNLGLNAYEFQCRENGILYQHARLWKISGK